MKLRCENLVKKYGIRTVVKGVSMEVNQGEIVGFLGPNGAGKSSLLKTIARLLEPLRGTIFLDGEDLCFCFPVPADAYSYLLVTLVKAKDNDDDILTIPSDPYLTGILSGMKITRE